jgi:hypothetical protein
MLLVDVYMDQPQGFCKTTMNGGDLVCELKTALYEIREAPRAWNDLLIEWLLNIKFKLSTKGHHAVYNILHHSRLYTLAI